MVCVVPFVAALIESAPCVPIAVTVSTRRSAVESVTSTFVVAVPLRSRTVTLSVPANGATATVSMPPVSAEPVNPNSTRVRASRPWTSIDSSAALPVALILSVPAAALDAIDAVRRAAGEEVVAVAHVDACRCPCRR